MNSLNLLKELTEYNDELIKMRRYLHENPELSYQEFNTSKFVADKLRSFDIEVKERVGGTGVIGLIKGKSGKVTIGFRADMDALPVEERTELPFASKNKGVMHACGHDAHTSMLLAAAYILSKHRDDLDGNIKFLFQPAEEDGGRGGALPMIEDGALENPHVDHVFGLHVMGDFPAGTFAIRGGAIMAAPDGFKITLQGKGGHGSAPSDAIDPIYVGMNVIEAIYGIRSRFIDQRKPVTISVCSVHAGTRDNIIPDRLEMLGTLRTLDENLRSVIKQKIGETAKGIAATFGVNADTEFVENAYPVTFNDPKITEEVKGVLGQIDGMKVIETDPLMGGEDVSRFLQKAPGTYYFLGTKNEKKGLVYPNHSPKFTVDEDYLKYGSLSHVMVAMHFAGNKK
jgi:carboxypeptidase Ss1